MTEEKGASEDVEELSELEYRYSKTDEYRLYPADGARGGVQPGQNFALDFYTDNLSAPEADVFELTEEGIGDFLRREGGVHVDRQLQTGVSLSQRDAFEMAAWIFAELLGDEVTANDVTTVIEEEFAESFE